MDLAEFVAILILIGVGLALLSPVIMFFICLFTPRTNISPENEALLREQLRQDSLLRYKCPICGHMDPMNEYDNIYGNPSGKFKCRSCGYHWHR